MGKQSICYILGAAPIESLPSLDLIMTGQNGLICADGGYRYARALGITPLCVVGDFDSGLPPAEDIPVIRVKPEKDETDLQLAVTIGIQKGYRTFVIYGGLGGRLDHSFANIQMIAGLKQSDGISIMLMDMHHKLFVLQNESCCLRQEDYDYFSLFSLLPESHGVWVERGKFPLSKATLYSTIPLGVSNAFAQPEVMVRVEDGMLLVICSRETAGN